MNFVKPIALCASLFASGSFAETATINGSEIYYTTVGVGTPILMMHGGLGLDHSYFRPYFDQLGDQAQVVYYDHLGNGQSARPEDYSVLSFERFIADADALMTHLGHDTFVLVGHSWGGFIAQEFAAAHPERLKGLVLANTVPVFDYAPTLSGADEQMAALGEAFSRPMVDDADFQTIWTTILPMYFKDYDPEIGAAMDGETHYSHAAWNAAGPLLGGFNALEKLPEIAVATLVIGGDHDGITPNEPGAIRLSGLLPNAELVTFENSGHFPFAEQEAQFFDAFRGWLNGLE